MASSFLLLPPQPPASPQCRSRGHSHVSCLASAIRSPWKQPLCPFTLTRTTTVGSAKTKKMMTMSPSALHSSSDGIGTRGEEKNFWAAVSLIVGTAVGPGMLGLPSATIRMGPLPSTLAIVLSWIYVVSSILLVAELSFGLMEVAGVEEVSFTSVATYALGTTMGWVIGLIYASLNFALLVACISGIGSMVSQWVPCLHPLVANSVFPFAVGCTIGFCPFQATDYANRVLCGLMLFAIVSLVVIGFSVGRSGLLNSFGHASWSINAILPAVPVTVLTLGFHVITPFVCNVLRTSAHNAAKAVVLGGTIPLLMVLSWNLVVLGFATTSSATSAVAVSPIYQQQRPIEFLLSVSASALPAVQGFAFSALATSLIGYALGFPKQILDMVETTTGASSDRTPPLIRKLLSLKSTNPLMMVVVLGVPVIVASFFQEAFSAALDYAGVYANCFLFGVLPPIMAWNHRSRRRKIGSNETLHHGRLLPGGRLSLILLFSVAVFLGIWH